MQIQHENTNAKLFAFFYIKMCRFTRAGLSVVLLVLFMSCAGVPHRAPEKKGFFVRVGIVNGESALKFSIENDVRVYPNKGRSFQIKGGQLYHVSPKVPDQNEISRYGSGTKVQKMMLLKSESGKEYVIADGFRLAGSVVHVKGIQVGQGFHYSRQENRSYSGELEFLLSSNNGLIVVNEITINEYLQGVLPGEMSSSFPLEALKAQAVAARTFLLSKIESVHKKDPFDVCDDVHCQVFKGVANVTDKIKKAVNETDGLVLMSAEGTLCSTPYSAVCGGHTENVENVWDGVPESYLKGVFDTKFDITSEAYDLTREENVKAWIKSYPNVYCHVSNPVPDFAAYSQKYFRWQVKYTQQELQNIIIKKTGKNIGKLIDIVPVKRGCSGRLQEILIKGTQQAITVKKELKIRQTLSESTLYSACFFIEKQKSTIDFGDVYFIYGAGWGHGVGMCQIGAGMMAQQGASFTEILEHYYRGAKIHSIY